MKSNTALLILGLLILPSALPADSHTAAEVEQAIVEGFAYSRENSQSPPDEISQHGSVEFWSSGGLMNTISPEATPSEWQGFNLHPKHIQVIPLVEGEVALAMYYSEGSMHPQGYEPVSNYRTRVMEVYVKEDGKWKRRAAHWSPVAGGAGTSQTAE